MQETTNLQKTMSIQACTERVQKIVAVSYPCAKAYVHSFGCQLNVSDGEKIKGLLQSMGFSLTETHEDADVIVFNTCAVRESAEDRVYGMLGVMKKYKETHPRTILILSGCMGSEPKTLEKVRAHYSFIDILMGTASIGELPRLLATYYDTKKFVYDMDSTAMPSEQMQQVRNSGFKASVPIMYGCNNFCTYCIIPYARGPVRSLPLEEAVRQTEQLRREGYREVVFTGIEISSWGQDFKDGRSLIDLLEAVSQAAGEMRLRLGSLEPRTVTEDFCRRAARLPNLCPQFHLSMQSGCDATLKRMNRKYDTARYLESVELLKRWFDRPAVTTDLITGFPEETEEEFSQTLDFIRRCGFAQMHIFPYSIRPGTPAANMRQIPKAVKEERAHRAAAAAEEMHRAYLAGCVGQIYPVLFEQPKNGKFSGHAPNYMEVLADGEQLHNQIRNVKITAVEGEALLSEIQEEPV